MKTVAESSSKERMCIPEQINFDKLNRILISYLKAGANEKAVSYRDASIRSGIVHTYVSANNKFFVYAGFLEEAQRGRFRLTERGAKYAQLLDWGRLDESKDQLREILGECWLVNTVLDYVSINKEATRDDLSRMIGSQASVSRAGRFLRGINAFIDMLVFSGLLQEEDELLKKGEEKEAAPLPPTISIKEKKRAITTKPSPFGTFGRPKEVSIPISLTVNVTDTTDIQKLRDILKAIKEELLEEKETE